MADIFFSYKREDRAKIEPLVELLEQQGLTVWWDPDLVAGERFDEVINREIAQARCVIVAWSNSSTKAVWVRDEASTGRDRGVLVPLSLDGARPPLGFGQYQTPDLSDWTRDPDDPRIRQLLAGIQRVVSGNGTRPQEAWPEPTAPEEHRSPGKGDAALRPLTRRRLLQAGAIGTAVLAGGGGVWYGVATVLGRTLPATRTEDVAVTTVDERGVAQRAQPRSVDVFDVLIGTVKMPFSVIPGGNLKIGSPDAEPERQSNEGPQQDIVLKRFALGRTAVTQAQWAALVDLVPTPIERSLARRPSFFADNPTLPVESISWRDATEFCARLSRVTGLRLRLPSETEWEYACRAGTTTPFHFGPTLTPDLANYCGTGGAVRGSNHGKDISGPTYGELTYDSGAYGEGPVGIFNGKTVPVATYPPNAFGLHEMHGNVWEHCADVGPLDYQRVPADGSPVVGEQGDHVLRGGSWSHNPAICRSAFRDGMSPDTAGWEGRVGLRVGCDLDGET
jgi:formylglycine-generating enzyme required for sulfatase activity